LCDYVQQFSTSILKKCIEVKPKWLLRPSRRLKFSSKTPDEEAERRRKALYDEIGRLEVEMDFCQRASEQLGIKRTSRPQNMKNLC
jgi:hypothetical protein